MVKEQFNELLEKVRKIVGVVNEFKFEQVQLLAFRTLIESIGSELPDANDTLGINEEKPPKKPKTSKKGKVAKKPKALSQAMIKDLDLKPNKKESINDFMGKKNPTSLIKKVTACVYYLKTILEINDITYDHVYTCFKHLGWRTPPNLPNTMQQAGTMGWLDTKNNKDIKITVHGDNLIVHDLPNKQKGSK